MGVEADATETTGEEAGENPYMSRAQGLRRFPKSAVEPPYLCQASEKMPLCALDELVASLTGQSLSTSLQAKTSTEGQSKEPLRHFEQLCSNMQQPSKHLHSLLLLFPSHVALQPFLHLLSHTLAIIANSNRVQLR